MCIHAGVSCVSTALTVRRGMETGLSVVFEKIALFCPLPEAELGPIKSLPFVHPSPLFDFIKNCAFNFSEIWHEASMG